MPSRDDFHETNPETNAWLASSDSLPTFSTPPDSASTSASAPAASRTEQAARVQALAALTGQDAEELAKRIPEDTLRRVKFPAIEQVQPDGTSKFIHDRGILHDSRQPLLAPDRAHTPIEKGSGGRGHGAERARASDGRFK